MNLFSSKKGLDALQSGLGKLILIVFAFLILIVFTAQLMGLLEESSAESRCLTSLILNSEVRGSLLPWNKNDERVPFSCPRYNDVTLSEKDFPKAKNEASYSHSLMREIADYQVECHNLYSANQENLNPFSNEGGTYCGICRKITLDEDLQKNVNTVTYDDYFSYLVNTKMNQKLFYSEYLYGFRKNDPKEEVNFRQAIVDSLKDSEDRDEGLNEKKQEIISSFENVEVAKKKNQPITLTQKTVFSSPSQEYLAVHVVFKGDRSIASLAGETIPDLENTDSTQKAICAGAVTFTTAAFLVPDGTITKVAALGGLAFMGACGAYEYGRQHFLDSEVPYIKNTMIIPAEDITKLGCSQTFGQQTIDQVKKNEK